MISRKLFSLSVILRREAPKNLVVGAESYVNSENEILRGAEGPEHCRGAQDDMRGGAFLRASETITWNDTRGNVILSAVRREESL